jgi:hypothetical protein
MSLILDGTNGVSDIDGTAATPAIRGTDANTGIFFPAADTIAFSEGGTEVARFDSAGNLGIGTSSPTAKAQIGDATVAATNRLVFGKAQTATESNLPAIGQQSAGVGNDLVLAGTSTSATIRFYTGASTNSGEIGTGSNAERMRITSAGQLRTTVTGTTLMDDYGCRAWVNFNGTGTVAIRASGNVSSITDNNTGNYTINFTTAMPDVNYSWCTAIGYGTANLADGGVANLWGTFASGQTASSLRIQVTDPTANTATDTVYTGISVFR